MRRLGMGLLWGTAGYLAGAFGGGLLVSAFSSNHFDRAMEAAMTGAFVTGPLAGLAAFVAGAWKAGRHGTSGGAR